MHVLLGTTQRSAAANGSFRLVIQHQIIYSLTHCLGRYCSRFAINTSAQSFLYPFDTWEPVIACTLSVYCRLVNMESEAAPVLSTPSEHIFEEATTIQSSDSRLSDEQLHIQYEIDRTTSELCKGQYKRIALQFPDDMLTDAPRVFELLREGLRQRKKASRAADESGSTDSKSATEQLQDLSLSEPTDAFQASPANMEKLCILGDTSYGACCVDEVAAEHVDADVVVHYGRSCLSPTARLPVIYVFTSKPLNLDAAVASFEKTYDERDGKVCLMADIPYAHHIPELHEKLVAAGYSNVYATEIVPDPKSSLPNRTLPYDVRANTEALREYAVFHVSSPPTSLLLILSSRVQSIHIFPTDAVSPASGKPEALEAFTSQVLRRRYALITRLSTVPVFGILINTLSVKNYLVALQHCQDLIARAGKKSYVFVVGKINAAKVANFSEIGGWVVIGCWESSLIESKEFFRPIITPFELEMALTDDKERVWGNEWVGDFSALLGRERKPQDAHCASVNENGESGTTSTDTANWDEESSDDEPPEFDLRTGRYVSHSRPMGRLHNKGISDAKTNGSGKPSTSSSALIQRAKGDIATVNGAVSPAAEFLRTQRTWQGLGSDHEVAYERDENGKIRGATMEEGRRGIARGYTVGDDTRGH